MGTQDIVSQNTSDVPLTTRYLQLQPGPCAHFLDLPEKEREQDDVFSKYMYNFPNNVDIQENVWCFCRH